MISTVSFNENGSYRVVTTDGLVMDVPDYLGNRDHKIVQEWVAAGGVIAPYVASSSLTDDEEFQALINNPKVKALFLAIAQKAGFTTVNELKVAWKDLLP